MGMRPIPPHPPSLLPVRHCDNYLKPEAMSTRYAVRSLEGNGKQVYSHLFGPIIPAAMKHCAPFPGTPSSRGFQPQWFVAGARLAS